MQIDWRRVQARLGLVADGVAGPQTYGALFRRMGAGPERAAELGTGGCVWLPEYGINTGLRLAHFLGQAAHESGGFRWMEEIWGPTDAQRRYEGRRDLGNTQPGDGRRYAGRGIFQLTGRANYRAAGRRIDRDLEGHPELAAEPAISVQIAADYWVSRGLSALADRDDLQAITRKINGGSNGIADRIDRTARAKALLLLPVEMAA